MKLTRILGVFLAVVCLLSVCTACGHSVGDTLCARFNVLYLADDFPDDLPEAYAAFADPSTHYCYNVEISLSNTNNFPVSVYGFTVGKENEKICLCNEEDAIIGLPAQFTGSQTVYYPVLADKDLSMTEVLAALGRMDVRAQFSDAAVDADTAADVPEGKLLESAVS